MQPYNGKLMNRSFSRYVMSLASDNRHFESDDMLLICHMTACDHIFKGLCDLWEEVPHSK